MRDSLLRPLAVAAAAVFFVSSLFPLVAAFVKDAQSWPRWWGELDVGLAFVLAALAFVLLAVARDRINQQVKESAYRAYRILNHGVFAILVVFFLAGDRIIWKQCLTGFAWRTWLLLYVLPAWIAAFSIEHAPRR